MNPVIQGNSSDASPSLPVKRKRGRPRKDQSLNRAEPARVPPGFERLNGNRPRQLDQVNDASDSVVGQTVTGVVEAVFDAGYLLAVRVGNLNTTLRGVVFKPGHVAPVTAENDVAPHVQMIRRNETRFPTESHTRVRRQNSSRSREKNMQLVNYVGNGSPPPNQVIRSAPPSKGKYVPTPPVHPVGARGTVVPVVLQPINLSNGLPANQPAPHLMALKGKHVQTVLPLAVYPPNGSTSQVLLSVPQTSPQVTPTGMGNNNGPFKPYTTELPQGDVTKPIKPSDVHLQGEANKGAGGSSESSKTQNGDDKAGEELDDMNEPLFVEPLQTRHSGYHFQTPPISRPVENNGAGRMSELLQALQENLSEDQVPLVEHQTSGSTVVDHEPMSVKTHTRDEATGQDQTHSQTGSM